MSGYLLPISHPHSWSSSWTPLSVCPLLTFSELCLPSTRFILCFSSFNFNGTASLLYCISPLLLKTIPTSLFFPSFLCFPHLSLSHFSICSLPLASLFFSLGMCGEEGRGIKPRACLPRPGLAKTWLHLENSRTFWMKQGTKIWGPVGENKWRRGSVERADVG